MAVAGGFTWEETAATVYVGQTITVPIASDSNKNEVPGFGPTAVADIVSASSTELQIIGQSEGTLTIPAGTTWTEVNPAFDMATTNSFTLTVLPDEPRTAMISQWADLINRVKALEQRQPNISIYDWRATSALTTTSVRSLFTYNTHVTNTGKVFLWCNLPIHTSQYTAWGRLVVNGTNVSQVATNWTSANGAQVFLAATVTAPKGSTLSVEVFMGSQNGATATLADYNDVQLIIMDY